MRTVRTAMAASVRSSAGIDTTAQVVPLPYVGLVVTVADDPNPGGLLFLCPGRRGSVCSSAG